jgi:hypothetical protein
MSGCGKLVFFLFGILESCTRVDALAACCCLPFISHFVEVRQSRRGVVTQQCESQHETRVYEESSR